MKRGLQAQAELTGVGFLRFAAEAFASFKIVVNGFFECLAQLVDRFAMKTDYVAYACNVADQQLVFVAIFDASGIAAVGHDIHGITPACSRNWRAPLN
ncbi:hypothetical protein D3C81_1939100 [compost metagenome]